MGPSELAFSIHHHSWQGSMFPNKMISAFGFFTATAPTSAFHPPIKPLVLRNLNLSPRFHACSSSHFGSCAKTCPPLYDEFVELAISEVERRVCLSPFPVQEGLKEVLANDGETILRSNAFTSSKIRLFRIVSLDGGESIQVLNMAIFPNPEYDLPIFCADFFSTSCKHIILLDLNPLYDAEKNKWYKDKYFTGLIPVVNKHREVLPWGGMLTTESLQFFSPLVIWTKLESRRDVRENLLLAFKEYLEVWLNLMEKAEATSDSVEVLRNQQAQHRYLLWRATKDPGRPLLQRLFGETWCEMYVTNFLFNGVTSLGEQSFLDYFPEYKCADGSINRARSVVGKSCTCRPWDEHGNWIQI